MDLVKIRDAACRWAFKRAYGRKPAPDELRDYQRALAERDRLGLPDARPIYARLRSEADLAPSKARRGRGRKAAVVEPSAAPAAPPPEPVPALANEPEPPPAPARPTGNGRPRVRERAEHLLLEELADGPRDGEDVIDAAAEVDVSERTLIAAAERLGVRSRRGQWWLPVEPT